MQIITLITVQPTLSQLWNVFHNEERHGKPHSATRVLLPANPPFGAILRMMFTVLQTARESVE